MFFVAFEFYQFHLNLHLKLFIGLTLTGDLHDTCLNLDIEGGSSESPESKSRAPGKKGPFIEEARTN